MLLPPAAAAPAAQQRWVGRCHQERVCGAGSLPGRGGVLWGGVAGSGRGKAGEAAGGVCVAGDGQCLRYGRQSGLLLQHAHRPALETIPCGYRQVGGWSLLEEREREGEVMWVCMLFVSMLCLCVHVFGLYIYYMYICVVV